VLLRQSFNAVTHVDGSPNEQISVNNRARKFTEAVVNNLENLWSIQLQHLYNFLMAYSYYHIKKLLNDKSVKLILLSVI